MIRLELSLEQIELIINCMCYAEHETIDRQSEKFWDLVFKIRDTWISYDQD